MLDGRMLRWSALVVRTPLRRAHPISHATHRGRHVGDARSGGLCRRSNLGAGRRHLGNPGRLWRRTLRTRGRARRPAAHVRGRLRVALLVAARLRRRRGAATAGLGQPHLARGARRNGHRGGALALSSPMAGAGRDRTSPDPVGPNPRRGPSTRWPGSDDPRRWSVGRCVGCRRAHVGLRLARHSTAHRARSHRILEEVLDGLGRGTVRVEQPAAGLFVTRVEPQRNSTLARADGAHGDGRG